MKAREHCCGLKKKRIQRFGKKIVTPFEKAHSPAHHSALSEISLPVSLNFPSLF